MLFSNSPIRRYTPPTCTLEIWGKRSPLSLWSIDNRLKEFKFKLHFDDPKMLDEEQVTLEGDRSELQVLCDIVTTYVQNLLASSSKNLPLISEKRLIAHVPLKEGNGAYLQEKSLPVSRDIPNPTHLSGIPLPSLKPKGLLNHELDCSVLITNHNKSKILLSISQLFDLANALEEYTQEAEISPNFENTNSPKKTVVWTITTLVALLAVGIPTVGLRWYQLSHQNTALNNSASPSDNQTIKDILPPVPLPPSGQPVPSPTLAPSLEQQQKLPPPPQVGNPNSPPRNPDVAVVVPPKTVLPPAPVVPPAPEQNTIILKPNLPSTPPVATAPNLSPLAPPPSPHSVPILSNTPSKSANTAYTMPPTTAVPNLPQLPKLPSQSAAVPSNPNQPGVSALNSGNIPNNTNNTTLLDTIPQVTETREYFQERWQPPESLKHTLEYRLVLNSDGSIGRIIPLGKAARLYLDQTNMPLMGEPFVSAVPENVENPQIRLVLRPDKTVKTFLEDSQEQVVSDQ
ncbi:conserved hypothetical protein [Gloeothece citriformis PCC 7424]|uniref:DUF4335 domain-containing protein n=1 Tax=Gloeothece citriformis (strain PCC 7424) TaxID=65393 RepID=B7KL11_GLOC7|nr:DUF4335 domain-containing protein [Gloeothece citriformis]ACK72383.1 conserved hypothetical protein [Gloeothece citriformis PCC 7424]